MFALKTITEFMDELASNAPVPGGVGTVTSSVLVSHVIEAAKRTAK